MLIDWFTVGAQALNFLILVWLLRRYLYRPILAAIDAREKRIAAELADAAAKQADAKKERDLFEKKNRDLDKDRAVILKTATDSAEVERQRLLDDARKAADTLRAKREAALRNEQSALSQDLTRKTQKQVFAIARKALSDLAGSNLEERMGETFVRRLRGLSGPAKEKLAAALKSASQPVHIRSAFDLPVGQRSAIQQAINETFSADIRLQFETEKDLISGLELSAGGQKVAWSIADYLATLEKSASELLHQEETLESKSDVKPEVEANPQPAKPEVKSVAKPQLKP